MTSKTEIENYEIMSIEDQHPLPRHRAANVSADTARLYTRLYGRSVDKLLVREFAAAIVLFVIVTAATFAWQQPISFNNGLGFDGQQYYNMAAQIAHLEQPTATAPFVYRLGTPLLVALISPANIVFGFELINTVAMLIVVLLLVIWLRRFISSWQLRLIFVALFITQWHAPIRFGHYQPLNVDPLFFVFLLLGLLLVHPIAESFSLRRAVGIGIVFFVGALFREVIILVPLALFLSQLQWPLSGPQLARKKLLLFAVPLLFATVGIMFTHLIAHDSSSVGSILILLPWFYKGIPLLIEGWFSSFGLIGALLLCDLRTVKTFLLREKLLLFFLLGSSLVGWLGGSDTERLFYWGMPVVYVLIGRVIEANTRILLRAPLLIALLVVGQTLAQRLFWLVPDYPGTEEHVPFLLTPVGSEFRYLDLFSTFTAPQLQFGYTLEYLLIASLVIYGFNLARRRAAARDSRGA